MPSFRLEELKKELLEPGISAGEGSFIHGEQIGVKVISYPVGTEVKGHSVPCEQIQSIMKGKAKYSVAGEEKVVGPGDAVLIRAGSEYGAQILEPTEVVSYQDVGGKEVANPDASRAPVYYTWEGMVSDFITPKYSQGKGPTIRGERIEVAFRKYPPGQMGKPHSHPNEQMQLALKGKVKGVLGGEIYILTPGGVILKPASLEHTGQILEEYWTLNCKNIVAGWSVYHARWEKQN